MNEQPCSFNKQKRAKVFVKTSAWPCGGMVEVQEQCAHVHGLCVSMRNK
jgi:hypothetical protein